MIEKLKIESFKTICQAELEFGEVNVLIGANGSGKSNFLEALALVSAAASGKVDQATLVYRGARASGYYRPMFANVNQKAHTRIEAFGKKATYEVEVSAPETGRAEGWQYFEERLVYGKKVIADRSKLKSPSGVDSQSGYAALKLAEVDPSNPASVFLKQLAGYCIYSADTQILHGWMKDPQEREPIGLGGGRLAESINELVSMKELGLKLLDEFTSSVEWFSGYGVLSSNEKSGKLPQRHFAFLDRYFRKDKSNMSFLSVNDVNEGALFLAYLAVLGLHPQSPSLFAVENVDHGLNPLLAKRLMTNLTKRILESPEQRQVFLTTHSPLVLDGLPLQDERVRLFTVDRDNNGHSIIRRFHVSDKHRQLAQQGWTLSRMWINKLIGGVPDV